MSRRKRKFKGLLDDGGPAAGSVSFWQREWKGMPEFVQRDMQPFKTVSVHFRNAADLADFAKLIGQPLTLKTKFAWWPAAKKIKYSGMRYVERRRSDEDES